LRPADLFARRPLIICGKWRGQPQGAIRLKGTAGSGPYEAEFDASKIVPSEANRALPILWARKRLARLADFSSGPDDEDTRGQVTQLGLQYHLLTAYTSFVAVHEVVRNAMGTARDVDQPLPLPHQVSSLAVGGRKVPEPPLGPMLAVVAAAGLAMVRRRRKQAKQRPS
jgi:Ca-activated chloride channel family protein